MVKKKRLLALLMCLAIVLTSESFTTIAYASQPDAVATTVSAKTDASDDKTGSGAALDSTDAIIQPADTTGSAAITSGSAEAGDTVGVKSGIEDTAEGTYQSGEGTDGQSESADSSKAEDKTGAGADGNADSRIGNGTSQNPETTEDKSIDGSVDKIAETEDKSDSAIDTDSSAASEGNVVNIDADLIAEDDKTETEEKVDAVGAAEDEIIANGTFKVNTADGRLQIDENAKLPITGSVKIPQEVKIIPKGIFSNQDIAGGVTGINFEGTSALTTIEVGAFAGSSIVNIDIPEGVTSIPEAAFKNSKVKSVNFKGTVTSIGAEAFINTPIETLTAKSVTEIKESAFNGCTALTKVTLSNVETIGDDAFKGCTKLNNMVFPKSLKSIGRSAFQGDAFERIDMSSVTGTVTMGASAFENNTKLSSLILPDDLAVIPEKAFYNCTSLNTLDIGDGISSRTVTIDSQAFFGCSSLTSVIFYNVKQFNAQAFDGCTKLTSIIIRYPNPDAQHGFAIEEDAFPALKNKITMKGFDGKVKAYANAKGYKYETLYQTNNITVGSYDSKLVTLVSSHSKDVKEGTEVEVTVTPKEGYALTSFEVSADETVKVNLASNGSESQVFRFSMPGSAAKVNLKVAEKSTIKHGTLSYGIDLVDNYQPDQTPDGITFDKAGGATQLVIKDGGNRTNLWYFGFSSKNTDVASVSDSGMVRAVSPGRTSITATSRINGKTLSIPIIVCGEKVVIDSIRLATPISDGGDYRIKDQTYPGITFDVNDVKSQSETVAASIEAFEKNDNVSLRVVSEWVSSNTSVASVASAKSDTNSNKIIIKKGASGQALITVTVKNAGEKEATEANTVSFMVCVVDSAPRLDKSSITVNSTSTVGTRIEMVPVEGYEIDDVSLGLYTKNSTGSYQVFSKLMIEGYTEDGHHYVNIRNSKPTAPFEATYSEGSRLYIRGKYSSNKSQFTVELTEVKVTKEALNPSIKFTGKINLFYSDPARSGEVIMTQTLKNEIIDKVVLVSDTNKKNENIEASDDPFAANFEVIPGYDADGVSIATIRLRTADLAKVNDKAVVSGYAYIYYKGYGSPVIRQITIPTTTVVPEYVLDMTSAETSTIGGSVEYQLRLLTKKKPQEPMDLQNLSILEFGENTTLNIFDELNITQAQNEGAITLRVENPVVGKHKAEIVVRDESWTKEMKYTFTLTVTDNLPKITPAKKTVILNQAYDDPSITVPMILSQSSASIYDIKSEYIGNSKYSNDAENVILEPDFSDGIKLMAYISSGAVVTNTTYKYRITPQVEFSNGEREYCAPFDISVKVTRNVPTVKFKSSTFSLNTKYAGKETATTIYTLSNLPADATSKALSTDYDNSEIVPVKATNPSFSSIAELTIGEDNEISVTLKEEAAAYTGKSYAYTLEGLTTEYGNGKPKAPKITLKLGNGTVKVKASASGYVNPVDAGSAIVYNTKISNFAGEIEDIEVMDVNHKTASSNTESEYFTVVKDDTDPRKVRLSIKEGVQVEKKKYELDLLYTIGEELHHVFVNVTPKQVLPKIKTKATDTTIYSNSSMNKTANVSIELVKEKNKTVMDANIVSVDFAKDVSKQIKNAFDISRNATDGTWDITLTDKTLAQNKTYTLKLETTYEGQIEKTTGSTFNVKVKVRN